MEHIDIVQGVEKGSNLWLRVSADTPQLRPIN